MGNRQTLPSNIQSLKEGTWVEAGQDQQNVLFSNVNPYRRRLLANIMTHQLIQEYELNFITQEDYNSYISELSYRQVKHTPNQINRFSNHTEHEESFVFPIRYFVNKSRNQMCTTIHTGYLYADKVDLRLKQINDIPFDDLMYMYMATLSGFKALYEKVGYFDIVEEMVFITRRGEVKVWMNANLAKNYPNYDKNSPKNTSNDSTYSKKQHQNLYGSQADMIRKLILLIQKNSDQYEQMGDPQHQLFSQFLQNKNLLDKLSFQHSIQEYHNYLLQNNLHCPQYMKSIPELFSPEENNQNPTNYQLSHVNQITSQHLTQMKKNFHPMETIPEDQKFAPQSKTILQYHQNSIKKFHQSQVASYQLPNIENTQFHKNLSFSPHSNKVVRPKQSPFTDMGQSRYSQQTQNQAYQQDHLKKSSNSINHNVSQKSQKPNSVSSLKYQADNPRAINNYYQPPYQSQSKLLPQNFIPQNTFVRNVNLQQQPYQTYQNVPNYHLLNNPIMMQQNQMQYQNFTPHQQFYAQTPSFFPINNQNHQMNKIKNQPFMNINQSRGRLIPQNSNFIESNLISQNTNQYSGIKNLQTTQQQSSVLKQSQNTSGENQNKSKIKYFTTKDSYQLDEEIANDLQKFLGLKVK